MTSATTRAHAPLHGGPSSDRSAQAHAVRSEGGVRRSLAQLLGSNVLTSLTGLACLPVLFRNLGPAGYGKLSLFLTALGLLSSLDISRPTLVREWSRKSGARAGLRLDSLIGASQILLTPLALAFGWIVFDPLTGFELALGAFLFVASTGPYARLAGQDRVGLAAAVRNLAWVGAFLLTAALSFFSLPPHVFVLPFVTANLIVLLVNRRLAGGESRLLGSLPHLATWRNFSNQSWNILGLSLATAVVVSLDRIFLEASAIGEVFGHYAAQYDLAIKLNVISSALGTVLLPALSQDVSALGYETAARRFVRHISKVIFGYFAVLGVLLVFSEEILVLVLGPGALEATAVYPLFVVGVFFALFGHLITPWQRACGDFRTHRIIYGWTAGLMIVVGVLLIPRYGALGAALTYFSARIADVLLVFVETRRIPSTILPRWHLGVLAMMVIGLLALAGLQFVNLGGLA